MVAMYQWSGGVNRPPCRDTRQSAHPQVRGVFYMRGIAPNGWYGLIK
jgi:hypothetical protein